MDGILVIDKPEGYTSHDVVAKARKILQTKKIGHTGTLDPLATGVLVLCIGSCTKLSNYLMSDKKVYEVEMQLGIRTDTADITGNLIEKIEPKEIEEETVKDVLKSFLGKQKQIPPMYSAIKKEGKKLYELARQGMEVEREAREIEIFDILNIVVKQDKIQYWVECSKGTYIRVLCEDIAQRLGTIGTMLNLRRVKAGKLDLSQAILLNEISEDKIISMEKLFDKKIIIEKGLERLRNGMSLYYDLPDGIYNLYTDHYIGIGKIKDKYLKREIIL